MDNYDQAKSHLEGLRKKFKKTEETFQKYNAVIQSYISEGHAEPVPVSELQTTEGKRHFLFHHGVRHPRKNKLRVVFNASKKIDGKSVNDQIMNCPDKLERLTGSESVR